MAVSRCGTLGPMTNCWESITAWTAGRISSLIARYCATRSRSGTFTTPVSESRATKLSDAAGLGNRAQGAVRLLVAGAAHGARRLPRRHGEALAALAHPAHATGRHAHHERVRRDVGRHDGTGADERVLAECDAAHDGGVRADRRPPLHEGGAILVLARHVAAGVHHVGENARRPAEHIVLEGDALVDRHVVLDLHVVADARAGHDHDVLAEAAALADDGAGHDVAKMPDLGILADAGAGVDVARFVDEGVRHLADHLDLELELDPGLLDDRLPHVVDGLEHVAGGGIARIDDIVRVQRRHLGAADREALQAALVDQHPGRAGAARVLEHGAAAGLVEWRAGLAPAEQARLHLLELRWRLLDQRELRFEHDHRTEVGRAILERDLLAGHLLDLALRIHHGRLGQHFGELRPVRAGVHVHAPAHRPRTADDTLHTRESRLRGAPRQERRGETGTDDRRGPFHLEAVEPFPDADHDAREAGVLHQHVRSQPQSQPREPAVLRQIERLGDVVRVGRHHEKARGAAQPVRGVAPQGLVLEHPAPELDLGRRRRGGGRRLGAPLGSLRRRLYRRLGRADARRFAYARTAGVGLGSGAFAPARGWFSAVVLSCNSCRLLTLLVRLGRAMIASWAALAADIVVLSGTRGLSAARRIA